MPLLVILREGRVYDVLSMPPGGGTLGMAPGGRLGLMPADDPRSLLRLRPDGDGVQVVPLPGAPPLALNGRSCQGGRLFAGDQLRLGKLDIELHPGDGDGGLARDVQRSLFELVASAASREDPDELLSDLLERALASFEAERGFVLLRPRRGGELEPICSRHIAPDEIASRISRTAVARAQELDQPILIGDAETGLAGSESTQLEGIRSVLCAPLGADGALYLDSRAGTRTFSDGDLQLFSTFAGYARLALRLWRDSDQLRRVAARAEAKVPATPTSAMVVGPAPASRALVEQLEAVAGEDVTVLILGETGTGKEVLAREVHRRSRRAAGPFVAVNCMAFGTEVVASELFGHEKGAFTGASERRLGRFELADGGTLFLDEVGELSLELQVKLLRVLQEREIERVGGNRPIPVDLRLVAATNQDLEQAIREGRFREDLYYRLNVFTLLPPPLRERRPDIPVLAAHFAAASTARMGKPTRPLGPDALEALSRHDWPGNVRELANVIERAVVLAKGDQISAAALALRPGTAAAAAGADFFDGLPHELNAARELFEGEFLRRALARAEGNISQAAKELGVPRSTIYRKCELLGIDLAKS